MFLRLWYPMLMMSQAQMVIRVRGMYSARWGMNAELMMLMIRMQTMAAKVEILKIRL